MRTITEHFVQVCQEDIFNFLRHGTICIEQDYRTVLFQDLLPSHRCAKLAKPYYAKQSVFVWRKEAGADKRPSVPSANVAYIESFSITGWVTAVG